MGLKHLCPICHAPTDTDTHPDFPFCSERCRLFDLGKWATEKYKITKPVIDEDTPEQEADHPADDSDDRS